MPAPATTSPRRHGFTLVEVLIATALLALLATMIVPRLSGIGRRRFDLFATQSADVLLMFAQRDLAGGDTIGLDLVQTSDGETRLRLLRLGTPPGELDMAEEWYPDPFVRPVMLPPEVDPDSIVLTVDGEDIDLRSGPFSHVPGDRRPTMELTARSIDGGRAATLTLAPYAVGPTISIGTPSGQRLSGAVVRSTIDLDASGRSREDW